MTDPKLPGLGRIIHGRKPGRQDPAASMTSDIIWDSWNAGIVIKETGPVGEPNKRAAQCFNFDGSSWILIFDAESEGKGWRWPPRV